MRLVDQKTLIAMQCGFALKLSPNTYTSFEMFKEKPSIVLFLHGSKIAAFAAYSTSLYISNAGYVTNVTKARLNALGAGIYTRAGKWYWKEAELFPNNTWVEIPMPTTGTGNPPL